MKRQLSNVTIVREARQQGRAHQGQGQGVYHLRNYIATKQFSVPGKQALSGLFKKDNGG
jgi:hypothetical protein